jgi:hypothetical protein
MGIQLGDVEIGQMDVPITTHRSVSGSGELILQGIPPVAKISELHSTLHEASMEITAVTGMGSMEHEDEHMGATGRDGITIKTVGERDTSELTGTSHRKAAAVERFLLLISGKTG